MKICSGCKKKFKNKQILTHSTFCNELWYQTLTRFLSLKKEQYKDFIKK